MTTPPDFSNKIMVQAAAVSRAVSTLQQNPEYALPPKSGTRGFLYFFNNNTRAPRPFWTFLSLVASRYTQTPFTGVTKETHKKYAKIGIQAFSKNWTELGLNSLINVKKNDADRTFTVTVPVFACSGSQWSNMLRYAGMDMDSTTANPPQFDKSPREFDLTANLSPVGNLQPRDITALAEAKAKLLVRDVGGYLTCLIRYTASEQEVSFLVNERFDLVKPMDVYGPVFEWVGTYYGQYGRSPSFSIPIRQIARSVAKAESEFPSTPRLSEDSLMIDEHADIYWIPRDLSDVQRFEDIYSDAFMHEDGTFGVVDVSGETIQTNARKKAPPPMPVFVDWINFKFAYTNSEGRLNVLNLERSYTVNTVHLYRWLYRKTESDRGLNFISQAISLAQFYGTHQGLGTNSFKADLYKFAKSHESSLPEDVRLGDIGLYAKNGSEACQSFLRVCEETLRRIEESPETAYARYSVMTILGLRAGMLIMAKYSSQTHQLKDAAEAILAPYERQGVDPDYQLGAVPYIGSHMGFLPHQSKVLNITREAPDNVLYPIEAGGGKTPVAIFEILREMQTGNKGPYLVMCPSHLVAQYVKEVVYVTQGRLNVVPITTYTIRRQGLERLAATIKAAPVNTIILTDYNAITLKQRSVAYGTTSVRVFPIIEFIRQFSPTVWFSDETHYLKSESSRRSAVHRLIADIPKKRGMSGTFVANTIVDLVNQAALFDPSIFGTPEDFVKEYALNVRGSKVLEWKPGTEAAVKQIMRDNFIMAEAKRKEWAAILPKPVERFHPVDLTERQYFVYNQILNQVIASLREEIERNQTLKDLLGGGGDEAEEATVSIDQLLKPYLARLERFITAPGKDVLGAELLSGNDVLSPKALKIVELATNHVKENIPGKVLIFTNYTLSAEAIYEAFSDEMRPHVVFYTADRKEECLAQFEKDETKRILVGVEQSLNTGGNLQHCFPGHTQVMVDRKNSMSIAEIFNNPEVTSVLSYDLESRRIEQRPILRKIRTKVTDQDNYVEVGILDNQSGEESTLMLTANHPMILKGGKELRADELSFGDRMNTFGGVLDVCPETCETLSDEHSDAELTVQWVKPYTNPNVIGGYKYDLEVEGNHNFFACAGNVDMPTAYTGRKIPVLVHNCSRLIRTETVWTPGVLEQGNARIGRPNVKNAEARSEIIYDWVISNRTIDVTKISYLMAKTISRAKYEEAGNHRFDDLEVPALFNMTLDTIMDNNDFETTMVAYLEKYEKYKQAMFAEFADYREKNLHLLLDENGKIRMTKATRAENLPGSKLLRRVPYVPGTELYNASELGLVRYDEYMRLLEDEEGEDDEEGDDGEEDQNSSALKDERERAKGLFVHTDRGDGEIVGIGKRTMAVMLSSGEKIIVRKMSAFVITRAETSNNDVRLQLLKMTGDVPIDAPVDVLESQLTERKSKQLERENARREAERIAEEEKAARTKRKQRPGARDIPADVPVVKETELEMDFTIVNDFLGLRLVNVDDQDAVDLAQVYGFKFSPEYYAAEVPSPAHMLKLFNRWKAAGYSMPKENSTMCAELYTRFKTGGRGNMPEVFGFATSLKLDNFYRKEFKVNPKPDVIMPFPVIQDGRVYIALPSRGHASSIEAIRAVKVQGVRWMKFESGSELIKFVTSKPEASDIIHKMLANKVKIRNIAEMRTSFRELRMHRGKTKE